MLRSSRQTAAQSCASLAAEGRGCPQTLSTDMIITLSMGLGTLFVVLFLISWYLISRLRSPKRMTISGPIHLQDFSSRAHDEEFQQSSPAELSGNPRAQGINQFPQIGTAFVDRRSPLQDEAERSFGYSEVDAGNRATLHPSDSSSQIGVSYHDPTYDSNIFQRQHATIPESPTMEDGSPGIGQESGFGGYNPYGWTGAQASKQKPLYNRTPTQGDLNHNLPSITTQSPSETDFSDPTYRNLAREFPMQGPSARSVPRGPANPFSSPEDDRMSEKDRKRVKVRPEFFDNISLNSNPRLASMAPTLLSRMSNMTVASPGEMAEAAAKLRDRSTRGAVLEDTMSDNDTVLSYDPFASAVDKNKRKEWWHK